MRKILNFIAGGLVGALVGGIAALMMAPASGDDLRGSARGRVDTFLDEIRRASAQRRAELEAQLEALKRGETPRV